MQPLAHRLIRQRYLERGATTRIVVLPLPGSGLPPALVEAGKPIPLDLLAGRPVNLELDDQGLSADLCFAGPPVRCRLPWSAVAAVQGADGELVETMTLAVALIMEDGSLSLAQLDEECGAEAPATPLPAAPPRMVAIKGQRRGSDNGQRRSLSSHGRPHLTVVGRDEGTEGSSR